MIPDKDQLYTTLQKHWGYDAFLPLQEETVMSILRGTDSLTVLPTGGGKSLCFQLPALLMEGMAVVISPLISLMKDQTDALKDMGIVAECFNSSLPASQQQTVLERVRKQEITLLYLSPERLQTTAVIDILRAVQLSFFVIDEAHCISHWGHDFRVQYRSLGKIKELFGAVHVHAFTATATRAVQQDIVEQLCLAGPALHVGRVDRANLTYRSTPRTRILDQIRDILTRHPNEAGIIYCLRRDDVDSISASLESFGFSNVPYHAGMSDADRHAAQEAFLREEVNIVVATIAFGMGIDRSNIRFVIHAGMPKTIEHYQQETGRAGRDNLPAFCYMFYGPGDYRLWRFFMDKEAANDIMEEKLNAMYRLCIQPQCRHRVIAQYFGQEYAQPSCGACDYCLEELDMAEDPLTLAQKILSCVARVHNKHGFGFGAAHIADILKGKLTVRIEDMGHHELSTFGIMNEESNAFIRYLIEQLIGQGFLRRDPQFSALSISEPGRDVLKGEVVPVLARPVTREHKKDSATRRRKGKAEEWEGIDQALFELLRSKRMDLASAKKVPAYIIFSDNTLRDMAAKKPRTRAAFAEIYGVGQQKTVSYADEFIGVIKTYENK